MPFRPLSKSRLVRSAPLRIRFAQQAALRSCQSTRRDLAVLGLGQLRGTNRNSIPKITAKRLSIKRFVLMSKLLTLAIEYATPE